MAGGRGGRAGLDSSEGRAVSEGKQGEKEEELKVYLGATLVGVGVARSGLAAGAGSLRRRFVMAAAL